MWIRHPRKETISTGMNRRRLSLRPLPMGTDTVYQIASAAIVPITTFPAVHSAYSHVLVPYFYQLRLTQRS